jgi:transcriptional regulator with XRE-family HTH domain
MPARLAEARRRAGLSQNALAKAAGLSQPTILRLEEGASFPALDTLERIARALDVSPCWLAFGVGSPDPLPP